MRYLCQNQCNLKPRRYLALPRTPGDGDGQGGLACCDSWGQKELDTTERLNWAELIQCAYFNQQLE